MGVPSIRLRAGANQIKDKERKAKEELKKRQEGEKKEEISPEEHQARLKVLRDLGLIK